LADLQAVAARSIKTEQQEIGPILLECFQWVLSIGHGKDLKIMSYKGALKQAHHLRLVIHHKNASSFLLHSMLLSRLEYVWRR